ncbi:alpha/beta fold hydrolase [Candidatus Woesearchaeota archaeon]|nr:alpha/beta fold hydrolase [Candidatus Woesearchaeota archaeon]
MKGGEPFFYKRGKKGVLLLHGFSSTSQEFRELGAYLAKKNITVYAPLLEGHGTHPEFLAKTNKKDWIKSGEEGLKFLRKHCDTVFVGGNSIGGNIAIILASHHKVEGLISLATPIIFRQQRILGKLSLLIFIIGQFKIFKKKRYMKKWPQIAKKRIMYDILPLNCSRDVFKLMKFSSECLPKVDEPALLMQSTTDHLVEEENIEYMKKHLGSKKIEIKFIPDSYHVFIVDHHKKMAFKKIYQFIKEN